MEQLQNIGLYEVVAKEKAELQQWKIDVEKEKALLKVAKKMKKEGYDVATIKKLTGLRKIDIERL